MYQNRSNWAWSHVKCTAAKECLVKAYKTTSIVSKTLLFSRSDKQQDSAWNRQQTEWNIVHKLSPSYLQKPAYGAMPLEPAETRPRSNFPESTVTFPRYWSAKQNTVETILIAGTEYFGETQAAQALCVSFIVNTCSFILRNLKWPWI